MKYITPLQLKDWFRYSDNIMIIDIRDPAAFEMGHIPGSVNIPKNNIPGKALQISDAPKVVICCTYGMKSEQVAIYLEEKHKLKQVWVLEGGLYDYAKEIDPDLQVI